MKSFWSYLKNDKYAVGCTGQTVYIYDNEENEIAKFKDVVEGYMPMFSPNNKTLIIKSNVGIIAVYSLETLSIIKKFRFSKRYDGQDAGFCFSKDGKFLYNIEYHIDSLKTRLAVYETENFSLIKYLFDEQFNLVLSEIEYDDRQNSLFIVGYNRDNSGVMDKCFVARLINDSLDNYTEITEAQFDYIKGYKDLERQGFTPKAKEWSSLKYLDYDLNCIQNERVSISDYANYSK